MTKSSSRLVPKTTLLLLTFFVFNFSFIACTSENTIIYYDFDGVTITRIDRDGETCIYYGRCDNNQKNCSEPFVKAKYSGFNSGLDGLLHFKAGGIVEVISLGGGYFTEERSSNDKLLINNSKNSTETSKTLDSIRKSSSVIHLSSNIVLEKELNRKSNSKVNATY